LTHYNIICYNRVTKQEISTHLATKAFKEQKMNNSAFFSATYSALKVAAIGFLIIFALGIITALVSAISALLLTIIPLLKVTTKATIYGYPLFITGIITLKLLEESQPEELPARALLPSAKPKRTRETETIENGVIIPPLSDEYLLLFCFYEAPEIPRQKEPLSNQLAIQRICWEALAATAKLLDGIKASEMKSSAAGLQIPKYRNMNKTQLLLEIVRAYEEAPVFSE
jgi:hypothetical protein